MKSLQMQDKRMLEQVHKVGLHASWEHLDQRWPFYLLNSLKQSKGSKLDQGQLRLHVYLFLIREFDSERVKVTTAPFVEA